MLSDDNERIPTPVASKEGVPHLGHRIPRSRAISAKRFPCRLLSPRIPEVYSTGLAPHTGRC